MVQPFQNTLTKTPANLQEPKPGGGLQPVNQPSLDDFIREARKIGEERTKNAATLAARNIPEIADAFGRRLISQNVGARSGVGQQLQLKAIEREQKRLDPVIRQVGLETAETELDARRDVERDQRLEAQGIRKEERMRVEAEAKELFSLVESGQIQGTQAEQVLRERGVDPETYLTPDELVAKQFNDKLKQVVTDPEIAKLINNDDELNFFLENGKTFDDEIADIMQTRKSIIEWRKVLPNLRSEISRLEKQIQLESSRGKGWVTDILGGGRNDKQIEEWKARQAALEQAVNEVEGGKLPVTDIEDFRS